MYFERTPLGPRLRGDDESLTEPLIYFVSPRLAPYIERGNRWAKSALELGVLCLFAGALNFAHWLLPPALALFCLLSGHPAMTLGKIARHVHAMGDAGVRVSIQWFRASGNFLLNSPIVHGTGYFADMRWTPSQSFAGGLARYARQRSIISWAG